VKDIKANKGLVITFPLQDEYTLLMRVVGPFFGFIAALYFAGPFLKKNVSEDFNVEQFKQNLDKLKY